MKFLMIATLAAASIFGAEATRLEDLTKESLEDFVEGKSENMIVACPAGLVLPLNLSLKGEFLALEPHQQAVKILKTCFVKQVKETFYFSADGKTWKDFSQFFTGKLGVSISIEQDKPVAGVECELTQRNS